MSPILSERIMLAELDVEEEMERKEPFLAVFLYGVQRVVVLSAGISLS